MSSTVGEAVVEVRGDVSRLKSDIAHSGGEAGKGFTSGFKESLKGAAEALGLIYAGEKALEFGKESIAEARAAQKASAVTEARIRSTGGAAHVTSAQVEELTQSLARKSGVDDATIHSGENMLLTFKNIRNEAGKGNDIFDQTSKTLLDLATSMAGGSGGTVNTKSAAIQLGKALNDPVKGITSLTRVGVQFTDQQKTQIAQMVKSGNILGAQKIILHELTSEFGGTAAAQATAGDKMRVTWEQFQESIGTLLLPTLDKLETFLTTKGIPKARDFVEQMKSGKGAGGQFASALGDVWDAGKKVFTVIGNVVGALNRMPDWAKKVLIGGAIGGFAAKKLGITALIKPVASKAVGLIASEKPIPVFVVNKGFGTGTGGGTGGTVAKDAESAAAGGAGSAAVAIAAYLGPPIAAALGAFVLTHVPGQSSSDKQLNRDTQVGVEQGGAGSESGGGMSLPTDIGKDLVSDPVQPPLDFNAWIHSLTDVTGHVSELRATLQGLPKGVATKVEALGADASAKQITDLANRYHLTPKEVRTILKAQDYASPLIRKVIKGLDDTDGKHPNPRIRADIHNAMDGVRTTLGALGIVDKQHPTPAVRADIRNAMSGVRTTLTALGVVDKQHPTPSLRADIHDAMNGVRTTLGALGAVDRAHPTATVGVNAALALQTLNRVQYDLTHIQSKTVTVTTVHRVGGSQIGNNAAGTFSSPGGPTIVGEHGRELVYLPKGSRVVPTPQTELALKKGGKAGAGLVQHIYLPTGDPQAAASAVASRWVLAGLSG